MLQLIDVEAYWLKQQVTLRTLLHWQSRIDQIFRQTCDFVDISLPRRRRKGAEGKKAGLFASRKWQLIRVCFVTGKIERASTYLMGQNYSSLKDVQSHPKAVLLTNLIIDKMISNGIGAARSYCDGRCAHTYTCAALKMPFMGSAAFINITSYFLVCIFLPLTL